MLINNGFMKNRIALIIPYFTSTPPIWLGLNFYTCARQHNIDFIYFTDCDEIVRMASCYHNIFCNKLSFNDYCDMVSERLNIDFRPKHAYKLCDLKPLYGFIHQDILKGYDFYGYGDNDLVYGNLDVLTNRKILDAYDVITTMSERIAGHFAIFRNTDKYRTLPFRCRKWKEYLQCEEHVGFDESDWVRLVLPEKRILTAIYKLLFRHLFSYGKWVGLTYRLYCNKLNRKFTKEMFTSPIPKESEVWIYDNSTGKIIGPDGRDLPYLHFLFFKKTKYLDTENYWKGDYWKIPSAGYSSMPKIVFSVDGVSKK